MAQLNITSLFNPVQISIETCAKVFDEMAPTALNIITYIVYYFEAEMMINTSIGYKIGDFVHRIRYKSRYCHFHTFSLYRGVSRKV